LAFTGFGAGVVAAALVALQRRLQLSRRTPSLTGHARIARRIASLVPFYEYDERRFFCSDNAPAKNRPLRRDAFMRLSALYASRFAETARHTAEVVDTISDLAFTQAYRVPFQYSRLVRSISRARFVRSPRVMRVDLMAIRSTISADRKASISWL